MLINKLRFFTFLKSTVNVTVNHPVIHFIMKGRETSVLYNMSIVSSYSNKFRFKMPQRHILTD